MSRDIHTPRFTFLGLSLEQLVRHREFFQFRFFSEVCHDASVSNSLILVDDWFIGCFNNMSTLDTMAYFPS